VLENLLRIFDSETLRTAGGDVFGRIYEYFLMEFAMQGAQDNGEFFTPPSLVQTIVNVIEPDHGIVFDPACGSGGMFVQTSHFIERRGQDTAHRVTFFGHEKTATTIRLARINLAVHGLQGDIRDANTYYMDPHRLQDGKPLWGHCDFVMANPPFNVDEVDAGKAGKDHRLPFGLPGVNKNEKVSNGNYLWISYFHSYLGPKGRAGFVMSSQASSAGHGEAEVRRKLVQTGDVDVMISIRSNFFYTRTVPCELWHLDRGKPEDRRDRVLMIDGRNVYRKVTRKIYDFSPEQLQNLTAIVWLYRGQQDRFLDLVQSYLDRTLEEAVATAPKLNAFSTAYTALSEATAQFLGTLPADSPIRQLATERDTAALACWTAILVGQVGNLRADCQSAQASKARPSLPAQKKVLAKLAKLAADCRALVKNIDLVYKFSTRVVDTAEKDAAARGHDAWDTRTIGRLAKELDARRKDAVDQLKLTAYFERQADWLLSRFPDAEFTAVPGLCRAVTLAEIEAADWSLTPGRYVGVAPAEVDEDFDFEQTMRDIHFELADLNAEAAVLAAKIQETFEGLGT
jgi:type I restriction enzyme M protein